MRWLTNMNRDERAQLRQYLSGKIIGDPQATCNYTVEELKEMGMVGVYAPDEVNWK